MSDLEENLQILADLGISIEEEAPQTYTAEQARIVAGFEEILAFVDEHGRAPLHGEERDIFERIYAVRLERLRSLPEAVELLKPMDKHGLLATQYSVIDDIDDVELLESLGISVSETDITSLQHVSPVAHRNAADEIAGREVCRDFVTFEPIFETIRLDLKLGAREGRDRIVKEDFKVGSTFIVFGQLAYIAEKGEEFESPSEGTMDARLRVIYDNGTESNILMRSLQRALNRDDRGRVVSKPDAGPLFGDATDNETGTIYVLRSLSEASNVKPIRDAMVKIGVTGQSVQRRIANAEVEATYLLAPVEVIDTYTLYNVNRVKLETMLKQIFASARVEISVPDRFGNMVKPSEWFMIPPSAVAEAVELIRSGRISDMVWSKTEVRFVKP